MEVTWYGPEPRSYRDPVATIETFERAGVAAAWHRAEDALAAGYSIAGYATYEAGYAEHPVAVETPTDEPLVALGVFTGPTAVGEASRDWGAARLGPLVATIDRKRYEADLAEIARALHAGDVYQVNYTVPFAFTYAGSARALADALRARAEVPYAAFVRHRERAIVSLSPELFFSIDGAHIATRPMKGTTAPDGTSALGNAKNRAEHVMIVDLLRNDLHRVCESVSVDALLAVEAYPTFATMTSTISGKLAADRGLGDAFEALFPCGSITGAPKRSAMRTIARLEGTPRRIAMGTIGYCDAPRRGMWNVAIRSAMLDETTGTGELRIGGGIVADSCAASEWAEIAVKRRAYDTLARPVGIFETIGVAADGSLVRRDAHVERLERSAFALGIPFDARAVRNALDTVCAQRVAAGTLVRLALSHAGRLSTTTRALVPTPAEALVCVSAVRLDAHDPTLRHKTDERGRYDAALAAAHAVDCFDGLLLNQYGSLADGARTTIFLADATGALATPSLADGALAGILRGELLREGRAYEATLRPSDLLERPFFVGNSARGLVPVRLANVPTAA